MARRKLADGRHYLAMQRIAAVLLNKQCRTADSGGPPVWSVDWGTVLYRKKVHTRFYEIRVLHQNLILFSNSPDRGNIYNNSKGTNKDKEQERE
jgi:hypothetical protein